MSHIIQWNCRGLKTNFIEISLLVQAFLPVAFCLQETHLKETDPNKPKQLFFIFHMCERERKSRGRLINFRSK